MEALFSDLRYGAKMLWKNKGVTLVALISLSLGIGANTAIFSIVNSLLLRPPPVSNPEQLAQLYVGTKQHPYDTCSYPSYLDFRERNEVFSGLTASSIWQFTLGGENEVEQVWGEVVTGNYFDVLGVAPHRGRTFAADEDAVPGRNPVVVISHGLWQRRFNSDQNLIGQAVTLNGQKLTVVGIAPPQYTGMMRGLASEVWVPTMMLPLVEPRKGQALLASRGNRWLVLTGRIQPGISIEQVRARFDVLSREMQEVHPEEWRSPHGGTGAIRELFVSVMEESEARIHPGMQEAAYALVALLVGIVNLVLLIACMNLANMLLARAVVRRREIAVRLALGASRGRIIRQLITESVLLALLAGAAGVLLAVWVLDLLVAFMPALPEGIRIAVNFQLDWRVFLYAIGFSTLTGVLFGLAPALRSSRADVGTVLKDAAGALAGGRRTSRGFRALLVSQVALSLLLLIGAGLVLRSLEKVRPTRLGFRSDDVLVASLNLNEARYDRGQSQRFYQQLSERVSSLPGVQAVSLVEGMPGGFTGRSRRSTEIEGYQPAEGESLHLDSAFVGPRYFTNMKVPVVLGRDIDERDREGAPCVAIINEAFGKRYFPHMSSARGKHLAKFEGESKQLCEIVGIVRDDAWQSLQTEVQPFYFLALLQSYRTRMTLLVSTQGDPAQLTGAVRRTVQELDPQMPINDVHTLRETFSATAYPFQLLGMALGACGLMAVLLASIGIYGVVSYSVAQRTREIGIRMALGALRGDILRMVVGQGMALVSCGLLLGLLLSFALTRVLASNIFETELLFGVSATDSLTFAFVTILLACVALVACSLPALRATKVDPIHALRYE